LLVGLRSKTSLGLSRCYLVLVSQESKRREWINFEAGFGIGTNNGLVYTGGNQEFSLGQLSYPLAGLQARNVDDLGILLGDVGNHVGMAPGSVDIASYLGEIKAAEAKLIYKSLVVHPYWWTKYSV